MHAAAEGELAGVCGRGGSNGIAEGVPACCTESHTLGWVSHCIHAAAGSSQLHALPSFCSEGVIWHVFKQMRRTLSAVQVRCCRVQCMPGVHPCSPPRYPPSAPASALLPPRALALDSGARAAAMHVWRPAGRATSSPALLITNLTGCAPLLPLLQVARLQAALAKSEIELPCENGEGECKHKNGNRMNNRIVCALNGRKVFTS